MKLRTISGILAYMKVSRPPERHNHAVTSHSSHSSRRAHGAELVDVDTQLFRFGKSIGSNL